MRYSRAINQLAKRLFALKSDTHKGRGNGPCDEGSRGRMKNCNDGTSDVDEYSPPPTNLQARGADALVWFKRFLFMHSGNFSSWFFFCCFKTPALRVRHVSLTRARSVLFQRYRFIFATHTITTCVLLVYKIKLSPASLACKHISITRVSRLRCHILSRRLCTYKYYTKLLNKNY